MNNYLIPILTSLLFLLPSQTSTAKSDNVLLNEGNYLIPYPQEVNLGGEDFVISIQRFDQEAGKMETASYENGMPVGIDFVIKTGEGYILYLQQPVSGVSGF